MTGCRYGGPAGNRLDEQRPERRSERAGLAWGPWLVVEDGGKGGDAFAVERRPPLHRRVQGRAEAPQVGGGSRRLAACLLRGEERAGGGLAPPQGSQAKATEAGAAVLADQHMHRLQVQVDEAGLVSGLQHLQQIQADARHPLRRQAAVSSHQLVERETLDQLTDHVEAFVVEQHVMEGERPRVMEGGGGARALRQRRPALLQLGLGGGSTSSTATSLPVPWSVARQMRPERPRRRVA